MSIREKKSVLSLENNSGFCHIQEYVHYYVYECHHVSAQVDAEDGDGSERKRNVDQDEEQEGSDLRDVAGQRIGDGLLQVIKDETTWKRKQHRPHYYPSHYTPFIHIDSFCFVLFFSKHFS